jgi:hypothetical protein
VGLSRSDDVQPVGGVRRGADLKGLFGRLLGAEQKLLAAELRVRLAAMNVEAQALAASDLVPQYNYWPVASAATGPDANALTQFTDGGDLENTGVVGLLAQTDVETIIAFVAASQPLEQSGATIGVSCDIAPLFGMAYSSAAKSFRPYQPGGINPFTNLVDPMGFLQVFDNSAGEFDALAQSLYAANGSGAQTGPAFCRQSLTVIANPLAGVAARSTPVHRGLGPERPGERLGGPDRRSGVEQRHRPGPGHGRPSPVRGLPLLQHVHQGASDGRRNQRAGPDVAWCTGDPSSPLSAAIRNLVFPA